MTLTIDFPPQAEAWLNTQAMSFGANPSDIVVKIILDTFPLSSTAKPALRDGSSPTVSDHCQRWIEE